jgi:DDE superfamily endonuclease
VQCRPRRACALDAAAARGAGRRVGAGRRLLARDRQAGAEKKRVKPWLKKQWCIPSVSAEYVAAMEDVLDLYAEPYDAKRPVVNFDEKRKQLVAETRTTLPVKPGHAARYDYEYQRNGVATLFACCEAKAGWRRFQIAAQQTKLDFAAQMKWLVDECYPEAARIRVVLDNLKPHKPAALYERFAPEEARRILRRLEFHYTPKHGSWLNLVEVELSVLERQCLNRRIPDTVTLQREVAAYEARRNQERATISWNFSVDDARRKLKRLYPSTPL